MKKLSMLSVILAGVFMGGCGSDDKDFELDTGRLTGVNWYYNGGTSNNRLSYTDTKVLEIIRFDKSGDINGYNMHSQADTVAGSWSEEGFNTLGVNWKNGNSEVWTVVDCNSKTLKVNYWGDREYSRELDYLGELTGDAFWANYFDGNGDVMRTQLGLQVAGNNKLRPGDIYALLSDDESGRIKLENYNNVWKGEADITNAASRKVRFSCRIGSGNYVKFDEYITPTNFESIRLSDVNMNIGVTAGVDKEIYVTWDVIGDNIFYKIDVYAQDNPADIVFSSSLFTYVNKYPISQGTIGAINQWDKINTNKTYTIRLSAVMLEPGVAFNSHFAENRVQAVLYVSKPYKFAW